MENYSTTSTLIRGIMEGTKQALKYWTLTSQSHPCATATRIIFYDTITVCQYSTINLDFIYKRTMTLVLKKI